jgi:hypothetical protein
VSGKKLAGGNLVLEGQKTRDATVIGPLVLNARLAWRRSGLRHAGHLVASFHIDSILRPDFLSDRVVGDQDTGYLARMVPLMMQRTPRAASLEFLSSLQEDNRLMAGVDLPATDVTLIAGQDEPTISEVTPSPNDSQKQESNEHVSNPHGLTPFAICLTSPCHFQMA